jgi:hypothetical protein
MAYLYSEFVVRASNGRWLRIAPFISEIDGVPVLQIDTSDNIGRFRINLNRCTLWDANPEAVERRMSASELINYLSSRFADDDEVTLSDLRKVLAP